MRVCWVKGFSLTLRNVLQYISRSLSDKNEGTTTHTSAGFLKSRRVSQFVYLILHIMFVPLAEDVSERLLIDLLKSLPEIIKEIMPNGFSNSNLIHVFHPTKEQQYEEHREMTIRLQTLFKKKKEKPEPVSTFEEFILTITDTEVEELYEIVSIYGDCIWDIFSNNHTVYNKNFESYDLGSFRGSGSFIADAIDKINLVPGRIFDYMDFYMGSFIAEQRANLIPVYEFIFKKLKSKKIDWEYSFPRLGLVSFNKHDDENTDIKDYDPGTAMEKEIEKKNEKAEVENLQQKLDDAYREEFDEARYSKPSQVVTAYYSVYNHWPKGHPLAE